MEICTDFIAKLHIENKNLEDLKKLTPKDFLSCCNENCLLYASEYGNLEIFNYIFSITTYIDHIDQMNWHERRCIHFAVKGNQLEIVKRLIELSCDLNARNKKKKTALMMGFKYRHLDIIEFFRGYRLEFTKEDYKFCLEKYCLKDLDLKQKLHFFKREKFDLKKDIYIRFEDF